MCTYLDQVRSTYYFRRMIPAELQPYILTRTGKPRTEWKLSLGTKDRDEAKRLIPAKIIESQALLDAATAMLAGGPLPSPAASGRSPWATEEAFEHWQDGEQDQREADARYEARRPTRRTRRLELVGGTAEIGLDNAVTRDLIRQAARQAREAAEAETMARMAARAKAPLVTV